MLVPCRVLSPINTFCGDVAIGWSDLRILERAVREQFRLASDPILGTKLIFVRPPHTRNYQLVQWLPMVADGCGWLLLSGNVRSECRCHDAILSHDSRFLMSRFCWCGLGCRLLMCSRCAISVRSFHSLAMLVGLRTERAVVSSKARRCG
jgi:hypothetical protein